MPVDPFGGGYDDYYSGGYSSDSSSSIWDVINNAINQGSYDAQLAIAGYPPGSTVVYAPQSSYPQYPQYPATTPQPTPVIPGGAPHPATPGAGIQLSNTTLMLFGLGLALFVLGSKRGR
jgi:hypothetical protein